MGCSAQNRTEAPERPSLPEGWKEYTILNGSFYLPEEFYETEAQGVRMLVPEHYPDPSDNVSVVGGDGNDSLFTEEKMKERIEKSYQEQVGGTVSDFTFLKDTVDGTRRVVARFSVRIGDVDMKQITCSLFSDNKYVSVTFTDVSGTYTEDFEKSLETVRITGK